MKIEISPDEVVVQRAWLETLLKYAEAVEMSSKAKATDALKLGISLPAMLGYISSAKFILKRK